MADNFEERAARHRDMQGMRVTLPDGKILEMDEEGIPTEFVDPPKTLSQ